MAASRRVQILRRLSKIADRLDENDGLYAERRALFKEARTLDPPILQRELSTAARVTETAVNKELKRPAKEPTNGSS